MQDEQRLPTGAASGSFTVRRALGEGVRPSRLRRRDLRVPAHGLRIRRDLGIRDVGDLARVLGPLLGRGRWFSHVTALALWGVPLPARFEGLGDMHITSPTSTQVRRPGVVGHRSSDRDGVGTIRGLAASRPIRAWIESAPLLTVRELVVAGDHIARAWTGADALRIAVGAFRGGRGIRRLREAAALVRDGSESPRETIVRLVLVDGGLAEPACNLEVRDDAGRFVGRVDLAYPELRIGIEYEGRHHQRDRDTYLGDIARREAFSVIGWVLVLVTDSDLRDEPALCARVGAWIARRSTSSVRR